MVAINFQTLYEAWFQCQRRKGKTPQAQQYAVNLLDELFSTVSLLQHNQWRPAPASCFVIHYPKSREVYAADFADRVVHHWLVPHLERSYKNYFIHDLYSNRKGKGTHAAVKRLQKFMRSLNDQYTDVYYLQLDVANFFNRIDKPILFNLLQRRLRQQIKNGKITADKARDLRIVCHWLLKQEVAATAHYYAKATETAKIPAHKQLRNSGKHKGLPIGNLTSQFFANVYLNELDQFVKHQLKCTHYLRYVDDFILLHPNAEQLKQWHQAIEHFIQQKLQLSLRKECILHPIQHGANFLGYIVRPHYLLVRRRVVGQLWQKLQQFECQQIKGNIQTGWHVSLPMTAREQLRAVLASYLGHFKHARHQRLLRRIWKRFLWLELIIIVQEGQLTPLWKPFEVLGFACQQAYFQHTYPNATLWLQKGYQQQRFPPIKSHRYFATNKTRAQVYRLIVEQQGYLPGGLRERCISHLFINSGVALCLP